MPDEAVSLQLVVQFPDDADEIDAMEAARQLRRELLRTTAVEEVNHAGSGAPSSPDAKGGALTWGTLLVTLSPAGGVLTTLIGAVQAFLTHARARAVTIQIGEDRLELTAASRQEQQQLVTAFLERHPGPVDPDGNNT